MRTPNPYSWSLALLSIVLIGQPACFGQGLVDFLNNPATLIYTNSGGVSHGLTEPIAGDYYYGLFIAPAGSSGPSAFTFTGLYATNQAVAGRLLGGIVAPVPGWLPNTTMSYLVRGWSATLGHDWTNIQQQLTTQQWSAYGFYGESAISSGVAGGVVGTTTYPALGIFGGAQLGGFDLFLADNSSGQGWVDFLNNSATLIYTNAGGVSRGPTEAVAGDYYYGLFIAPPGTIDPQAFTFTGLYATNQAAPGRLLGGVVASVPGWLPGTTKSFLVRGWSATLGHDWTNIQQQLNTQQWSAYGFYGQSAIGSGVAGGYAGANTYPALGVFGGLQLGGFDLFLVGTAPRLGIFPMDQNVVLTWPTDPAGFTLQSTTNVLSAWAGVLQTSAIVNGLNTVTNPRTGLQLFFRLSR